MATIHAQQLQATAHGSGFVVLQANPADAGNPFFMETGAYELTQPDGVTPLGMRDLTLTYTVGGSVNLMTGVVTFSGGVASLFADDAFNFGSASSDPGVVLGANDGTRVASFAIASGGGFGGGQIHLEGTSFGPLAPGYVFVGSTDLALAPAIHFDADIGNAINLAPSATLVTELACKGGFPGPGCNGTPYENTPYYFIVSDGASVVLSAVPEPSSVTLFLSGLAGIALFAIRRNRRG
jgi:hypothetical protein